MDTEQKLTEILQIVKTERELNNTRHNQMASATQDMRQDLGQRIDAVDKRLTAKIDSVEKRLTGKIDQVYHALSEDIQAVAGDQEKLAHRLKALERKSA